MAETSNSKTEPNVAAIYARVSDKSQDGEDKTSISEQTGEMEAYRQGKGSRNRTTVCRRADQRSHNDLPALS